MQLSIDKIFISVILACVILISCVSESSAAEKTVAGKGDADTDKKAETWDESGTLDYAYAYARNYIGYKMRRAKWKCVMAFTSGGRGEVEHSVWTKGEKKLQLMIWRIDANKTGYSHAYIRDDDKKKNDKK